MRVTLETPTAVESTWTLVDSEGNAIADSKKYPGATFVMEPYFYRGMFSQTLFRALITGKRGRRVKQALRVSAAGGKLTAESMDKAARPVEPSFDKDKTDKRMKA